MSDNRRTDNAQVHDGETGETGYPRRVILDGSLAAERRATGIAERYWRAVGGEAGVPSLNDIDMEQTSSIWSDGGVSLMGSGPAHIVRIVRWTAYRAWAPSQCMI